MMPTHTYMIVMRENSLCIFGQACGWRASYIMVIEFGFLKRSDLSNTGLSLSVGKMAKADLRSADEP